MVAAKVNGEPTLLIVDTGATEHVLTRTLARRAGLTLAASVPGHDIAGASVGSDVIERVRVDLGGSTFAFDDVPAIDGPGFFDDANIGGFLSPQRLSPDEVVMVDLRDNRLRVGHNAITTDGLSAVAVVHHAAGTLGVRASFDGGAPVTALLDTGAESTDVESSLVAPAAGEPAAAGAGVSGEAIIAWHAGDVTISLGDAELMLDSVWVREEIPAPEGAVGDEIPRALLGMDVLGRSILVIGPVTTNVAELFLSP